MADKNEIYRISSNKRKFGHQRISSIRKFSTSKKVTKIKEIYCYFFLLLE